MDCRYAVIGGSGLESMPGVKVVERLESESAYGRPSAPLMRLAVEDRHFWFLSRHGEQHDIAPHRVNYRANIAALADVGAERIIAVNAVGVVPAELPLGTLAVPAQLIDYTWGRASTFFDGDGVALEHIDFTEPYDETLRQELIDLARAEGVVCEAGGIYGATQGPRLETAAEVDRLARDGVDYIGMTGMPEAGLARELELDYACLAVLVNRAAGRGTSDIHADILEHLKLGADAASRVALAVIREGTGPTD